MITRRGILNKILINAAQLRSRRLHNKRLQPWKNRRTIYRFKLNNWGLYIYAAYL